MPITAEVTLAACSDKLCVPEHAALSLQLSVGSGHASADAALIRRAAAAEPKSAGPGTFVLDRGRLVLQMSSGLRLDQAHARFFPDENGFVDAAEERPIPGSPLRISSAATGQVPRRITGVVSDGPDSYRVSFNPGEFAGAAEPPLTPPQPSSKPSQPPDRTVPRRAVPPTAPSSDVPKRNPTGWIIPVVAAVLLIALAALVIAGRRYARSRS